MCTRHAPSVRGILTPVWIVSCKPWYTGTAVLYFWAHGRRRATGTRKQKVSTPEFNLDQERHTAQQATLYTCLPQNTSHVCLTYAPVPRVGADYVAMEVCSGHVAYPYTIYSTAGMSCNHTTSVILHLSQYSASHGPVAEWTSSTYLPVAKLFYKYWFRNHICSVRDLEKIMWEYLAIIQSLRGVDYGVLSEADFSAVQAGELRKLQTFFEIRQYTTSSFIIRSKKIVGPRIIWLEIFKTCSRQPHLNRYRPWFWFVGI